MADSIDDLRTKIAQSCRILALTGLVRDTLGHVSVRLRSCDADAVITGDLMHHPVQMAEPDWCSGFDSDLPQARATRRAFCQRYADGPVRVLGTHFHHPTAGRIVQHGTTWRFRP